MNLILKKIIFFGVSDNHSPHECRRIKTINIFNALIIFFLIFGMLMYNYYNIPCSKPPIIVFIVLAFLSSLLIKLNKVVASFFILSFNICATIFYISIRYPFESGIVLFYFPLILSMVILNNDAVKDKYSFWHILISIAFFILSQIFKNSSFMFPLEDAALYKIIYNSSLFISIFLLIVLSIILSRLINNQYIELTQKAEILAESKYQQELLVKDKEILLAELHHRVKNNMATIVGLIGIQEDLLSNPDMKKVLADCKSRIMSIAIVNKLLYNTKEMEQVSLKKYSEELIEGLSYAYYKDKGINIAMQIDEVKLSIDRAIPYGLILNECMTNCFKYAYSDNYAEIKRFSFNLSLKENWIIVEIRDYGKGFEMDFNVETSLNSLGIYLTKSLAQQLGATISFNNDKGAVVQLKFMA